MTPCEAATISGILPTTRRELIPRLLKSPIRLTKNAKQGSALLASILRDRLKPYASLHLKAAIDNQRGQLT
jgi:hypothetical protein